MGKRVNKAVARVLQARHAVDLYRARRDNLPSRISEDALKDPNVYAAFVALNEASVDATQKQDAATVALMKTGMASHHALRLVQLAADSGWGADRVEQEVATPSVG